MRRLVTVAFVAGVVALAPAAAASTGVPPTAHIACKRAVILGKSKCIARGQYCTHTGRAERDYKRYGLSCSKRDRNGRYHLQ